MTTIYSIAFISRRHLKTKKVLNASDIILFCNIIAFFYSLYKLY